MSCKHKHECCFYEPETFPATRNAVNKRRAFGDPDTEYYRLRINIGKIKRGTIFYYDPNDDVRGSKGAGCLKLAWTENGSCQCGLCGDTIVFHTSFKDDERVFIKCRRSDSDDTGGSHSALRGSSREQV